ncbi:MAG: phosphatidylglycerol lysyltransferase domain-containing protein [Actinomycetota bacterium]|nr:GNAT family N-acetyltransferase [Actinomycetota bacterium]
MSERLHPRRARHVLAVAVGTAGATNVVSAMLPAQRARLEDLRDKLPLSATHVATTATLIAGVTLLVLARQLWRGKHAAMVAASALLVGSVALHLAKGLDFEEAALTALLATALIVRRKDFFARSDPASITRFLRTAPLLVAGAFVFGVGAIFLNRGSVHPAPTIGRAVAEVIVGLVGVDGPLRETGRFGTWFPASLVVYGIGMLAFLTFLFFRPVVQRLQHHEAERLVARGVVAANDADSLSYFALRYDKDYFFNEDRSAFIAYRYVAGIALISGDPVGPREAWAPLLNGFFVYAAQRDWTVSIIGAAPGNDDLYARVGLKMFYLGDEAIIDVQAFSLEGRRVRNIRQSANHVKREGYRCMLLTTKEVSPDIRAACRRIAHQWRGKAAERGFSMALGRMFAPEDPDCLFVLAVDGDEKPRGFLHLVPYNGGRGYSLEAMRRERSAPAGLNEFLIIEAVSALRERGVEKLSLNFATFAQHLAAVTGFHPVRRVSRRALLLASRFFQIESLLRFNRKFHPEWLPRYLAYEDALDLPRAGLAMLQAEAFIRLPLVGRYF